MEFEFRDWSWKSVGKVELASNVFEAPLRKDIIARVIKWQRAKSRSGTHSTKTVSMVSGTTRKPWAQKETGRARQGSLRSAQFRGGGVVFGPHPRDYEHKLNKKVRALGCVSSLTFKLKEGLLDIVKDFDAPFTKTSAFNAWMEERKFKSVLFVLDDSVNDEAFFRCVRNVPYCDVIPVRGLNVLDIVKHKNIVCDLTALKAIEARFAHVGSARKAAPAVEKKAPAQKAVKEAKPAAKESKVKEATVKEAKEVKPKAAKTTGTKKGESK